MKVLIALACLQLCLGIAESLSYARRARSCRRPVDLVFAIDASGSVGDDGFRHEKMFVAQVARNFRLGRRSTHAAVIVYSSRAKLLVSLWSGQNFRKFLSSVNRIPYYGGGTRIDLALRLANSGVFSRMKGMRAGVPKIFILMTDGYQTKTKGYTPLDQAVLPLRKKGVRVYSLAIGKYTNKKELRLVVEKNSDMFKASTFSGLRRRVASLVRTTCDQAIPPASGYYPLNYRSLGRDFRNNRGPRATLRGAFATSGPHGQPGGAYYLSGNARSYIDIPNSNRGKLDSYNSISIFLWANSGGLAGPIFNYRRRGHGVGLWLHGRRTLTGYIFGRRGIFRRRLYYSYMLPRRWYYIGLTYEQTTGYARLWVDGKVVARSMIGKLFLATQYPIRMGSISGSRRHFRGKVSCLQVFGASLSAKQVSTIKRHCSAPKKSDPCRKLPCQNGGSCLVSNKNSLGYRCRCRPGYTGRNCQQYQGRPTGRPTRPRGIRTPRTRRPLTRRPGPTRPGPTPLPPSPSRGLPTGAPGTPGGRVGPRPSTRPRPGTILNLAGFRLELLGFINTFRRMHGTGPLMLSQTMSAEAQLWAQKISSQGVSKINPNTKYGVNIYTGSDSPAQLSRSCVVTWYASVRNFDWSNPRVSVKSLQFTQLVWEDSVRVGVGMARGLRGRFYVVVYFDPPGNKAPKIKQNVRPYTDSFILIPQAKCPTGYTLHLGTCYKYHSDLQTWEDAIAGCARESATVVSLHNAEQDRYIATLAGSGKNTYTWTGLNDRITEGTYMWSDGSSVEYTNWQPGEPSGQDCVAYKSSAFGSLADRTCTERHRYVCQQPLEGLITYRVEVEIISAVWIDDFSQRTSLAYLQLKKKIEELVLKVYVKDRTLVSAMVENFRKVAKKKNQIPGSKIKTKSSRQSSSVRVFLILRFGPRVVPDPTVPLQKHLTRNQGRTMAPLNEKVKITAIKIVKPGVSPAFLGSCSPSCASKCLMSCNPMCCTSRIVLSSATPYPYPVPVRPPAKPYKVMKPAPRPGQRWPYGARKQTSVQQPALPITLSVTCVPTAQTPCPPGMRSPQKIQATYTPRGPALGPRPPVAPQTPYGRPAQVPCVPSFSNPCPPPGAMPYPGGLVPAPVQQIPRFPGGMMPPCIPTQFSPCPPPKLSRPSTKKPKSRAQMPLPRPAAYTYPFGLQRTQPMPNVSPYVNPLLRYNAGLYPAVRYPRPVGISPLYRPQNVQVPYRPCVPTQFNRCPPQNLGPKAVKVSPAQKKNAKKEKPSEISLTQPVNLMGQIYIHPQPGLQFSPFKTQVRLGPQPKKKGKTRGPAKKKATGRKGNKVQFPARNPVRVASSPMGFMGRVMLGQNGPGYGPVGMPRPCFPLPGNPCPPVVPQPMVPYTPVQQFRPPVGLQHPFAGLQPLTPIQPPRRLVPKPQPVVPATPQGLAPSRSFVIQLPPIRINYPNNQVAIPPSVPIQQPVPPVNNLMRPVVPGPCPQSCIYALRQYCPGYCPSYCCKNPNQRKAKLGKKRDHIKHGK